MNHSEIKPFQIFLKIFHCYLDIYIVAKPCILRRYEWKDYRYKILGIQEYEYSNRAKPITEIALCIEHHFEINNQGNHRD